MREKSFISESRIIDCLESYYGIDIATLVSLPWGADLYASIYKAQTHQGLTYFVKVKQGHHHQISTTIIELLQDSGIREIIPFIKTVHGQATQPLDDCTVMVSPFIKGQDGFNRDLTDDQWRRLGKAMRQIHEMNVPDSIQSNIRQETYSPKWRKILRSLYPLIESEASGDKAAMNLIDLCRNT